MLTRLKHLYSSRVLLSSCRKMLQSLGRPELHMALEVTIVSGSGQEHAGCLLLTTEVLFVVSLSEDTQQQAFPITEVRRRSGLSVTNGCPWRDGISPPTAGGVSAGTGRSGPAHPDAAATNGSQ